MGRYGPDPPPPEPYRPLSADEQARVLEKLKALELEAMFTEHWTWGLQHDLMVWEFSARRGELRCSDVPTIAAWFERFGIKSGS